MSKYEFDRDFRFRKARTSARKIAFRVMAWIFGTMTLAVLYYIVLSLFISTDTEKRLIRENRMYARLYPELEEKQQLLEDVTLDLQGRDDAIYERIFHTQAPRIDPRGTGIVFRQDTVRQEDLVEETFRRAEGLRTKTSGVDSSFLSVFAALAGGQALPPVSLPLEDVSYTLTGASTGERISPFSKVESFHGGLDIIAAQGDPVLATADGIVRDVTRSGKGLGNVVTIDHGNGYETRYGHLGNIYVSKGQKVMRGKRIALVGSSGKSLVPHLHYEILRDGVPQDPSRYFVASLGPQAFADVAFMAASTEQSLD